MKGDKAKTKKPKYNESALIILSKKYGFSNDYIRKCIRKDRVGIMPDKIAKEYEKLDAASKKAINQAAKEV
ncbi:MAG: hypothetical protein C0525_01535 [Flavobacterium sp.]|uniref:hypothetical protein n=1 Tax=Flavobacterium sp. TaxID=239 RepID=UPI0025BF3647|nr:hypothetical protein [Flavobacterium sp.]MBA4133383.1 hypothetical protein [Flavobacterium sp.]